VAEFIAELYVPRADESGAERVAHRVRVAADELTREGTPVRYVRSIFVPEDETCFVLCEATAADAVIRTAERASLRFARVAAAVTCTTIEEVQPWA
jgi:hypothetical protein